ncbi:MAG TPA: sugar ABC transporter ATP-binding protein [Clostridiales bacterium]|nr:sugar ABC transporter ATP-binding protein [Clostridiales bacterium]
MPKVLVEMKDIMKTFPGVKALDNAQLTLYEGEVLGLLGENGAGKSTLMNVLGGIYRPDSGEIRIDGQDARIDNVVAAQNLGIAFIHQEIALVPYLSVAENIFLGRERMTAGMVDKNKMYREARQWLEMVGLDVNPATMVNSLSIGRQQMVEIAKACSLNMKLMIMDEPTSSLSEKEVELLFAMINRLKEKNIGIIYISHKLSEIFAITNRVCVMRDGGYVGTVITQESSQAELVQMMVGRELSSYYVRSFNEPGEVVLEARNINSGSRVIDCSFQVRKKEILGFYGLVGAGRSELIKAVMGLYPRDSGSVFLKGKDVSKLSTMKIQERGLALVPENRKLEGLILKNTIQFNISVSVLGKFIKKLRVNTKKEKAIVDKGIADLNIKTPSRDQTVSNLSGGNQQKVVLAKWLASNPDVLILDEPTRGVDVGAKAEIYSIMNNLAAGGMAIIMISSEMPEIINMCDRILIMSEGRIRGNLDRSEFEQQKILHYAVAEGIK